MKSMILLSAIWLAVLSGCSASFQTATISNDLYQVHSRTEIAERQKAEAEAAKAAAEARQALWESKLAEAKAAAAEAEYNQSVLAESTTATNDFSSVLADDYESAYARRLYGFESPTYRMPSSYYNLRYSDAYFYASAYDPAFYNVMVAGDQVWVEPKYVTSMFGSWGATVVPVYSWYYGWNYPFYSTWRGYYPRYTWYGWSHPNYRYHPPHFGSRPPHSRPPHYVGGKPHRPNVVHRPNTSRPGGSPSFSGGSRPGSPSHSTAPADRTNVRRSSGTVTGSGQYRGSSSSSGSQYRSSSSGSRSSSSSSGSSGSSYRSSGSSSSSSRGSYSSGSSSSRGSYGGGGYSGGGNSSGGSHGGGQRR